MTPPNVGQDASTYRAARFAWKLKGSTARHRDSQVIRCPSPTPRRVSIAPVKAPLRFRPIAPTGTDTPNGLRPAAHHYIGESMPDAVAFVRVAREPSSNNPATHAHGATSARLLGASRQRAPSAGVDRRPSCAEAVISQRAPQNHVLRVVTRKNCLRLCAPSIDTRRPTVRQPRAGVPQFVACPGGLDDGRALLYSALIP